MLTELQIDISFDQVLALVKQLPVEDKLRLTRELEKEGIKSKLDGLLHSFRADDLSLEIINEEVENVRQQIYESQKH